MLVMLFALSVQAADPLAGRTFTWYGNVGIVGGIPNRTTIFTNFSPGATAAQINAAIVDCPSNQVVFLEAGTFNLGGNALTFTKNGVTLRGAGPTSTILTNTGPPVINANKTFNGFDTPVQAQHVNILSGLTQGSTNITIAATNLSGGTPSITVGSIAFIDQNNDTNTGAIGSNQAVCLGCYSSLDNPGDGRDRYKNQIVRIVDVSGTNVTIDPPINGVDWDQSLTPRLWWGSADPLEMAGIEDLQVSPPEATTFSGNIQFQNFYQCWVKNVRVHGGNRHVYANIGSRFEVRHSYFGNGGGEDTYAIALFRTSGSLVEDNIDNGSQTPNGRGAFILLVADSGSAYLYNYHTNYNGSGSAWQYYYSIQFHGAHPQMNLSEGNVGAGWTAENTWGSSGYNVSFRDRWFGWDEGQTRPQDELNNVEAIIVSATNRYCSVAGGVLGTATKNTIYEDAETCSGVGQYSRVFYIGGLLAFCAESEGNYDPVTKSTLVRAYNWDSATDGIVAGGFSSSDIVDSLYYPSKPSYFGILSWPSVDPDDLAYSNSRTNNPAAYRFAFGEDPPAEGGGASLTGTITFGSGRIDRGGGRISFE